MKKIQATIFSTVAPTTNETVANGYALGQWWQNTTTGLKYYHKTDGVWVSLTSVNELNVITSPRTLLDGGTLKENLDIIEANLIFSHITSNTSSGTISLAPNTETTLSTTLTNSHTITITPTAPSVFTQSWDAVINLTIGASLPSITITAPSGVTFVWRKSSTVDFAINKSKTLHFIWISSTRCDVTYSDNY